MSGVRKGACKHPLSKLSSRQRIYNESIVRCIYFHSEVGGCDLQKQLDPSVSFDIGIISMESVLYEQPTPKRDLMIYVDEVHREIGFVSCLLPLPSC
jgi:hypothetical protein